MTRGPATPQLALALGHYDNRRLFSEHFLAAVLVEWPEWITLDAAALYASLQTLWQTERSGLIGHELHDRSSGTEAERHAFLEWLASVLGVDPRTLPGSRHLGRTSSTAPKRRWRCWTPQAGECRPT